MEPILLFPGQGAYHTTTLRELARTYPSVHTVLNEVDDATGPLLGHSITEILLGAAAPDVDTLLESDPELLQLGIFATSVAVFSALRQRGVLPRMHIGHSLGEISALVCAGAYTVGEGALIVHHRTQALLQAEIGDGYMAAVGLDAARADGLTALLGDPDTVLAVENRPSQSVLSGRRATMDLAREISRTMQVSFTPLKSPFPFHSPLLAAVSAGFQARIELLRARPLQVPVFSPILGRQYRADDDIPTLLAQHLHQRVRFASAIKDVYDSGATVFVECGAREALTRAVTGTLTGADVLAVAPVAQDGGLSPSALETLTGVGALTLAPPSTNGRAASIDSELAVLHKALLPEVTAAEFARYWEASADLLREQARQAFAQLTATPVVQPAHTSAVSPGSELDRPAVVAHLIEVYAHSLEYPPEVFGEDVDLEAELGVDSVKQTELLGKVSADYGLAEQPADFRIGGYNTIGKIADLLCTAPRAAESAEHGDAVAPVAIPEPAVAAPVRGDVVRHLIEVYAHSLEYPPEVFGEDVDLEAELGVDSVKQTELLGKVSADYGLGEQPADFRIGGYNTIGKIADLLCTAA